MKKIIFICVILLSYSLTTIGAAERPSHVVKRTSGTIYIDGNASEEDWNAIAESLHLLSVPGMRESIKEGMNQDLSECFQEIDW